MKKLTAADKTVHKMTRDGVTVENLATGEVERKSGREAEENVTRGSGGNAAKMAGNAGRAAGRRLARQDGTQKPPEGKLNFDTGIKKKQASRLTFGEPGKRPAGKLLHPAAYAAGGVVSRFHDEVHESIREAGKENVGVQSGHFVEQAGEHAASIAARTARGAYRAHRMGRLYEAEGLRRAAVKSQAEAAYREILRENPGMAGNPLSRFFQKQRIKRAYARELTQAGMSAGNAAGAASASAVRHVVNGTVRTRIQTAAKKAAKRTAAHWKGLLAIFLLAVLGLMIAGGVSSCSSLFSGSVNAVLGSSYTAEDADIRGAEADYAAMEANLRERITRLERDNPGHDEYTVRADEVGHNPWQLAAFLTVLYEDYSRRDVQKTLKELFALQYGFSTEVHTETVTETKTVRVGESLGVVTTSGYCNCPICCGVWSGGPTASGVYPKANHTLAVDAYSPFVPMGTRVVMNGVEYTVEDTGNFARYGVQFDVYYDDHATATNHGHRQWECFLADDNGVNTVEVTSTEIKDIFTATVTNHTLSAVIDAWPLTKDQRDRYEVLLGTKGNRDYLFADDIYANPGEYTKYDIPGEALTDERFARMIREAEKYLGYPYVWGGASPETSFDCSGYVSWVINHCGNGWNYGRLTADGLKNICSIIPKGEAKPGDLIFFQGTYDTAGASHVGIYVGNGMMIHCGSPIQYTSMETTYWQQHFYCFGRLP